MDFEYRNHGKLFYCRTAKDRNVLDSYNGVTGSNNDKLRALFAIFAVDLTCLLVKEIAVSIGSADTRLRQSGLLSFCII